MVRTAAVPHIGWKTARRAMLFLISSGLCLMMPFHLAFGLKTEIGVTYLDFLCMISLMTRQMITTEINRIRLGIDP